jgi:hypothetical protein
VPDTCPITVSLDVCAQIGGDLAVALLGVLVDYRGTGGGMTHPMHQVSQIRAHCRGEVVARMPEIMEMEARQPNGCHGLRPTRGAQKASAGPFASFSSPTIWLGVSGRGRWPDAAAAV